MTLAPFADITALLLAVVVPIVAVWRYRKHGIVIGSLAFWVILAAVGPILNAFDPNRDAAILDSIWVLAGWLGGLMYAGMIYAALWLIRRLRTASLGGPSL